MIDQWKKGAKYWDKAWNPIIGCRKVSEGCANCYAARTMERFGQSFEPHLSKLPPPPRSGCGCGSGRRRQKHPVRLHPAGLRRESQTHALHSQYSTQCGKVKGGVWSRRKTSCSATAGTV